MTQEDKELLLKDLSTRLPYGVKMYAGEDLAMTLKQIDYKGFCESWENEDFKCYSRWMLPYLRPMSSMTEEEEEEFVLFTDTMFRYGKDNNLCVLPLDAIHWLLKNHFDFMGLIPKGLAIEVTEENNPYKE